MIYYNEGHKFPRYIDDEDFIKLKQFVKDQYCVKNGAEVASGEGPISDFEINYDSFNFEVRYP